MIYTPVLLLGFRINTGIDLIILIIYNFYKGLFHLPNQLFGNIWIDKNPVSACVGRLFSTLIESFFILIPACLLISPF